MQQLNPAEIARSDPEMTFNEFASFNDGSFGVFRVDAVGAGPWEMHPDTDELLFVQQGRVSVELHGEQPVPLVAGEMVVVPRGIWHRHVDAENLIEIFYTPGTSLHSSDPADPAAQVPHP